VLKDSTSGKHKNNIRLFLLSSLVLLSIIPFCERVSDCLLYPERQNTTDMDIFAGAGKSYLQTGKLYQRSENYQKTYAPGAGVYKFPPAYQLTIIPLLKLEMDPFNFLLVERIVQLVMYLSATMMIIVIIGKYFIWMENPVFHISCRYKSCQFILISLLVTFWSMGFFESFVGLEPEILVYFLLALAFHFSIKRTFLSGAIIACATAIKIYPVLMLLFFIFKKDKRAISGFIVGIVLINSLSIFYIGIGEHIFYIKNILPVLLKEKAIYHTQNYTIESLFHAEKIISNISGVITSVTKLITVFIVFITGLLIYRKHGKETTRDTLILFGMLVSSLLLCLSNYWQQYQVILMIPLLCLLACSLQKKSIFLYTIIMIISIATSIQEGWYQDISKEILGSGINEQYSEIVRFLSLHPLWNTHVILFFTPLLWIFMRFRDLVFLAPGILFLFSGILIFRENLNQ